MKLSGASVGRFVRKPDPSVRAALIYGDDAALVAARRDQLRHVILGDDAPELRLTRLDPATIRKDPAALFDALREGAFFGGRRLVQIDGATDGMAGALSNAISEVAREDAFLLITAGSLPARSKLRTAFEGSGDAAALPCYADSVSAEDLSEALSDQGLRVADADAEASLRAQRMELDYGAFQQLLAKLGVYKLGDGAPLTSEDIAACAPAADDPQSHDIASAVLSGDLIQSARALSRVAFDSSTSAQLLIALTWQMKRLYSVVCEMEDGASRDRALAAVRPPVFGEARSRLSRQLDSWTRASLESALRLAHDAQLASRSGGGSPPDAATARTLLRIAMMAARK